MDEKILMTADGLKKAKERLEYLKGEKRQEVVKKLAEARSYGDLSENSEYDQARSEQATVEQEIFELETMLKQVEVVDSKKTNSNKITIGNKVEILNVKTKQKVTYHIVSNTEADPLNGKISITSPIGSALIGKKVDEVVIVRTPAGIVQYKVVSISA